MKRARSSGADAAEAFAIAWTTKSAYIEDDVPKVADDRQEAGLGLRVARGKRVAFTSTTLASASDLRPVIAMAIEALRRVPEDPDFAGFPAESARGEVAGAWDAETAAADIADVIEAATTFTGGVRDRKGASVPKAIFRMQDYAIRVSNSNAVDATHRGTLVFCATTAKVGSKDKVGEGILKALHTSLGALDYAAMGARVAQRAAENLAAKPFKGKMEATAVLDPMDLGEMILQTVGAAANGKNVHRKRSAWIGKMGQEVASVGVTIRDKPRLPRGLASCVIDDEGSATKDRTIVQAGILKGYLSDHYHARLLGVASGNGFRRAVATVEGAYARPAETETSNLVVEPGTRSLEKLIAEVDRGVYIEKFAAPEVNEYSGSFAQEVRNATLIKDGELREHVKFALLSGNFYEGLKKVVGIGRDLVPTHAFLSQPGCAYVPAMAFDGFELVGQT